VPSGHNHHEGNTESLSICDGSCRGDNCGKHNSTVGKSPGGGSQQLTCITRELELRADVRVDLAAELDLIKRRGSPFHNYPSSIRYCSLVPEIRGPALGQTGISTRFFSLFSPAFGMSTMSTGALVKRLLRTTFMGPLLSAKRHSATRHWREGRKRSSLARSSWVEQLESQ